MAPHSDHSSQSPSSSLPNYIDIPVLIVGGGPAGLLQAHLLSKLGVKCLVIERYPTRLDAPKAHAISPRTFEICRQFGIDANEIRALGTKRKDAFWVNFVTSLTGVHVGVLPYERMDKEVLEDTPLMIHNIPQPTFEELVATYLVKDGVEVRKNHSFVTCEQSEDTVITTVEDRAAKTQYQIRSRQVIACDGAKSKVRDSLGISCEGDITQETMMTIHFNANLRPVIGEKLGMLHWVMDPEVSGFIIGYDLGDNQVLICNFDANKHPVESWDEELCRKTVTAAIGTETPFDVLSNRPWIFSRKVAKSYNLGNVFLAGDAAHSFPPTGGLGLNTGLGDVHNLAYKIALQNHLCTSPKSSSLLSTYQHDRKTVALINAQQSVKNGIQIFALLKKLGIGNAATTEEAKKNLYARVKDPAWADEIKRGIEGQREHFDNHGLHIGYVYGDTTIPECASPYFRKYVGGARIPHVWLKARPSCIPEWMPPINSSYVTEFSPEEVRAKEYSTLDLCAFDAFTLICRDVRWKDVWSSAKTALPSQLKVNVLVLGKDFELLDGKYAAEWIEGFGLDNGGAVLVRPDQHILARLDGQGSIEDLLKVLKEHVGI
ncbi:hypothetical protein BP6252_10652 [Coleophoma cylindrospora]|uniref:FAD-binding domain-containing protein n=1 Tax=Coleophoma cylindrospora TaxID=1849047 RepID=A0A3D8QTI3_9HELO|nr:hypothetical protein BP6252_10652 [Coleophoma cylindrospora]